MRGACRRDTEVDPDEWGDADKLTDEARGENQPAQLSSAACDCQTAPREPLGQSANPHACPSPVANKSGVVTAGHQSRPSMLSPSKIAQRR